MLNRIVHPVRQAVAYARHRDGAPIVRQVREENLTYLEPAALLDLWAAARSLDDEVPGSIIEAGTALGGSAIVLAAAKPQERPLFVYDVFSTIPPPSEKDGSDVHARYAEIAAGKAEGLAGDTYYGYEENLRKKVEQSFGRMGWPVQENNVHLVEGLFEDTIHPDGPVALAHIDGDWYESVKVCLERIWPHLSPGGRLIIDDYGHWSGCRTAVDEFFADRPDYYPDPKARRHMVKRA